MTITKLTYTASVKTSGTHRTERTRIPAVA